MGFHEVTMMVKKMFQVSLGSWSSILTLEDWRMNEGNLMTERKPPNLSVFDCICIIYIHVYIVLNDYCIFYRYECPSESLSLPEHVREIHTHQTIAGWWFGP